jgi:YgiT-type zinc finger domain-containing protein
MAAANIPFMLKHGVVLIKNVPAEVCQSCREPYTHGAVTDRLTFLLSQMSAFPTEIAVIAYTEANLPAEAPISE